MNLRRRNSLPHHLILPRHRSSSFTATATSSSSSSSTDFELLPTKPLPSYTSLKDLIPCTAVIYSPTASTPAGGEIPIRNRLVKQAAWAYLQPMSTSPDSGGQRRSLFSILRAAVQAVANVFCLCFL